MHLRPAFLVVPTLAALTVGCGSEPQYNTTADTNVGSIAPQPGPSMKRARIKKPPAANVSKAERQAKPISD
jgi:ABC-type uncharacterized transport system auxiliary subunit